MRLSACGKRGGLHCWDGVARCIRAIHKRRRLERLAGLIMAIPEKRLLGTWGLWLGILLFSGLGLMVIPANKTLRAAEALRERALPGEPTSRHTALSSVCYCLNTSGTQRAGLVV